MRLSIKNSELLKKVNSFINKTPMRGTFIKTTGVFLATGLVLNATGVNKAPEEPEILPEFSIVSTETGNYDDVPMREQINLSPDEIIFEPKQEDPINVSLEEVNAMNIILNDSNCMDDFMNSVCEQLDRDGIKFSYTKDCKDIDVDGAVVITLDQQYMAGPGTVVFAPLENRRNGNADALALATEKAFYEKGFLVDGIACGQMGFRENEDGTVSERVPTPTEDAINENTDASFVTVSFGTSSNNVELVVDAIEGTLTRYCAYVKNNQVGEDLIYCVEPGESIEDVANHFGTTTENINGIDEETILAGQTVVNPNASSIREFRQDVPTNLYVEKTIWSK